ncbi:MAG: DNA translocase FtsK, partial [Oscillospiraceae bacterium]|nr:DNA translocase FtsK [Oscillospiraceae bacterium]
YIKSEAKAEYSDEIIDAVEQSIPVPKGEKQDEDSFDHGSDEDLIERAIDVVVEMGQASTSSLQRKLKLGYARAARIMDQLEELGVIGPYEGAKPRRVLLTQLQADERKLRIRESKTKD